jgi:hypothetical protein
MLNVVISYRIEIAAKMFQEIALAYRPPTRDQLQTGAGENQEEETEGRKRY